MSERRSEMIHDYIGRIMDVIVGVLSLVEIDDNKKDSIISSLSDAITLLGEIEGDFISPTEEE